MREIQENSFGPIAAAIQAVFVVVNLVIMAGGVQMARITMRPLAYVAAILAMINFGSCCCVAGIPVGIWAIVILSMQDVATAFELNLRAP